MNTKLIESTIPENYAVSLKGQVGLECSNEEAVHFVEVVVAAVSDFLAIVKSKTDKTALLIEDLKGNMIMGAVVEFNKNEEEDAQDNWNYYWTFDPEDVKDAKTYSVSQSNVQAMFIKKAASMYHMSINNQGAITRMVGLVAAVISDYLDQNAKTGEDITIEHEGYFEASATVENDVIIKSFLPSGEMKTIIKDDAATEA